MTKVSAWGKAVARAKKLQNENASQCVEEIFKLKPTFPQAIIDWEHLVTLDFETYYDDEYTLSKLSTSEYIRDDRFETIMCGIKIGFKETKVVRGDQVAAELAKIDWTKHDLLCHHAQFDGFILSHHYDVIPRRYFCTLSMARGWFSNDIGAGLDEVSKFMGRAGKHDGGDALVTMKGVHLKNMHPEVYAKGSTYCAVDVEETFEIFRKLVLHFPESELTLVDMTVQMFTCPVLRLDQKRIKIAHAQEVEEKRQLYLSVAKRSMEPALLIDVYRPVLEKALQKKADDKGTEYVPPTDHEVLVFAAKEMDKQFDALGKELGREPTEEEFGVYQAKKLLGSGDKLACFIRSLGYEPPRKISPTWVKKDKLDRDDDDPKKFTWAFAKDDFAFLALQDEGDDYLSDTVDARIAVKGNSNITKAERLMVAGRGGRAMPVYYKYAAAHTWRFGGGDKLNWQNFKRGGELRKSILAPKGHVIAVADSSQIEARMNAWLWGQDDLVDDFRDGKDIYSLFATESIYLRLITKADKEERHVGKTAILGLGYGMGAEKFRATLARGQGGPKVFIDLDMARGVVNAYRKRYHMIVAGWKVCKRILEDMAAGRTGTWEVDGVVVLAWEKETLWLPNGMRMKYPGLAIDEEGNFHYTRKGAKIKIYGAKLNENIVQALARIVVASYHMEKIGERYPVVMTTHDEVGVVVPLGRNEPQKLAIEGKVIYGDQKIDFAKYKPAGPAGAALKFMIETMKIAPPWCARCPVSAEGVYNIFYDK